MTQILQFAIVASLLGGGLASADAAGERPHVLFIAVDDLNHWVTHLGRHPQAKTPHQDPSAMWETPAITTHGFKNHSIRTERWKYTRYENGDEELYDETTDRYEWTNLAGDVKYDHVRSELAAWLPDENAPPPQSRTKN